jgi:hypothetical protein
LCFECYSQELVIYHLPKEWQQHKLGMEGLTSYLQKELPAGYTKSMSDSIKRFDIKTIKLVSAKKNVVILITTSRVEARSKLLETESDHSNMLTVKLKIKELGLLGKIEIDEVKSKSLEGFTYWYENPDWVKYPNFGDGLYRYRMEYKLWGKKVSLNIKIDYNEQNSKELNEAIEIVKTIEERESSGKQTVR